MKTWMAAVVVGVLCPAVVQAQDKRDREILDLLKAIHKRLGDLEERIESLQSGLGVKGKSAKPGTKSSKEEAKKSKKERESSKPSARGDKKISSKEAAHKGKRKEGKDDKKRDEAKRKEKEREKGKDNEKSKDDEKRKRVEPSELPSAVRKTVRREIGDAEVEKASRETRKGKTLYKIKAEKGGKEIELKIAEDGSLLEKEVDDK